MFSRYYAGRSTSTDYVQRYRASPHKARLDHVARAHEAVIAQHLREWLRLTIHFDAGGRSLPTSVHAPEVQAYLAQRLPHGSPSRQRVIRASARLLLETDAQGHVRRRIAGFIPRPLGAWFEPAVDAYRLFLRQHRGLADRTVSKRASGSLASSPNSWSRPGYGRSDTSAPRTFSSSRRCGPAPRPIG
jgi:hypothetical protein